MLQKIANSKYLLDVTYKYCVTEKYMKKIFLTVWHDFYEKSVYMKILFNSFHCELKFYFTKYVTKTNIFLTVILGKQTTGYWVSVKQNVIKNYFEMRIARFITFLA